METYTYSSMITVTGDLCDSFGIQILSCENLFYLKEFVCHSITISICLSLYKIDAKSPSQTRDPRSEEHSRFNRTDYEEFSSFRHVSLLSKEQLFSFKMLVLFNGRY